MIGAEEYARDRWEIYGHHFPPFTVRAQDRQTALERAMDRMAEVNNRRRGIRFGRRPA